jgi:hypothetical protein
MDPVYMENYVFPAMRYTNVALSDFKARVLVNPMLMTVLGIELALAWIILLWATYDIVAMFRGWKIPPFVHAAEEYKRNGGYVMGAVMHAVWMDWQWQTRFLPPARIVFQCVMATAVLFLTMVITQCLLGYWGPGLITVMLFIFLLA